MTFPVAGIAPQAGARHVTLMRDAAGATYPNPMRIVELIPRPAPRAARAQGRGERLPLPGLDLSVGASDGIGRATAPALAENGAREGRALENVESRAAAP
jgi:hypothetical protein